MGLLQQDLRNGILKATSTDLTDWDNGNTDLDLYINRSLWDIMDQFAFREKEAPILSFQTVVGTRNYDLTVKTSPIIFEALQRITILDPVTLEHTPLDLITDFTYEEEYSENSALQAKPTSYFRRGNFVYLYPTPDLVYTINLYYLQIIGDIASGGPIIPQSWHEIIGFGAQWRALLDVNDTTKADAIMKYQALMIEKRTPIAAKELKDTKLSGITVLGRDY